jgi:outer membrane protein TolC
LLLALVALQGCAGAGTGVPAPAAILHQSHYAQPPHLPGPESALTLAQCFQLAGQRQPRVASARASLAVARDLERSLATLPAPALLAPELPIRRQQATLGVSVAAAGLDQVERETAYAVTRTWYAVVYARAQEKVARGVVERITATGKTAREMLKGGARDVTTADVARSQVYQRLAQARVVEAEEGVKRALAALREAVGLERGGRLELPAGRLPRLDRAPVLDEVVAWALSRRGELVRADVFVHLAGLEADAQATQCRLRVQTFASASDVHNSHAPQGVANSEYRPPAVPPEMPPLLVGTRSERVQQARALQARAEMVLRTTRNLIALEAEDALLRSRQAQSQAKLAAEAATDADKLADQLEKDLGAGQRVKVEEVLTARVTAAQARAQLNEYLFRQIVALADLERITAGAFNANLLGPLPAE